MPIALLAALGSLKHIVIVFLRLNIIKMDWLKAAIENLIPLSQEQSDLKTALAEWHHTGVVHDYGMSVETCQLCTKENLRYHFEILNSKTENSLLVGSKCIERFDIAVYGEDGKPLEGKEKAKKLQDEINELKREKVVQVLRNLWQVINKQDRDFVKIWAVKIKKGDSLPPNTILSLFKLLVQHEIQFDPQLYKVSLRSNWDKDQLLNMPEQARSIVWEALGEQQRIAFLKYKEAVEQKESERQEALKRLEPRQPQEPSLSEKAIYARGFDFKNSSQSYDDEQQRKISELFKEINQQEAECELCGQITNQWYVYDNKTKKCKCMDCSRRQ